jgi:hypothetical protein
LPGDAGNEGGDNLEDQLEEQAIRDRDMRRRPNKRSLTNQSVSPGEALLADNSRKWARDVAFLDFKIPVAEMADLFNQTFLKWLDQSADMDPSPTTAFALKYGKDVFKSLKDKRNNVQEDCRLFLQFPEVGEALMLALVEAYGGVPLEAVTGPVGDADHPLNNMTPEDLTKRTTLQEWSLLKRQNPEFQFLYRMTGGDSHYSSLESGSYVYMKWTKLVSEVLTSPRSFPSFWPWYETMLRRSR